MRMYFLALTAVIASSTVGTAHLRSVPHQEELPQTAEQRVAQLFRDIETAINSASTAELSTLFGHQVYVSLRDQCPGYVSGNQAASIVQEFFHNRKTVQFRFSTTDVASPSPYATGGGMFAKRGMYERLQVYVGLAEQNHQWVITQFSVY
jgi:hypothetical protein